MRALIRDNDNNIKTADIPEPYILNEDDVKIRVMYSAFCRDDMRYNDKSDIFSQCGVMGHEVAGVIEDIGVYGKYAGFNIGDRVVSLPWDFCGECKYCVTQQHQYCSEAHITIGTMTKYIIRKVRQLVKIPSDVTFRQAVLMEPVGCVLEAISKLSLDYDKEVLIIGGGFAGINFVRLLKMKGVKQITVIEPIAERRRCAISYGADYSLDPNDMEIQLKLSEICRYNGFDIIIETSSHIEMLEKSLGFLCRGGTLQIFTYYGSFEKISFPSLNMYSSNIRVIWSCLCGIRSIKNASYIISKLSLEDLITKEYNFSNVMQAFEKYKKYEHMKVGVKFY
ncbi:MAG: alcohol dehydrogenase catalytic domain-containing protein [Clostridium sp.]